MSHSPSVPSVEASPRLLKASPEDRQAFEIGGDGVNRETLDEDLSAKGITAGIPALEYRALAQV